MNPILAVFILAIVLVGMPARHQEQHRREQVKTERAIARIDSTIRVLRSDARFMEDRVSGVQDTILMHEAEIKSLVKKVMESK